MIVATRNRGLLFRSCPMFVVIYLELAALKIYSHMKIKLIQKETDCGNGTLCKVL